MQLQDKDKTERGNGLYKNEPHRCLVFTHQTEPRCNRGINIQTMALAA